MTYIALTNQKNWGNEESQNFISQNSL